MKEGRPTDISGRFTLDDLALTVPAPETGELGPRHFFAAWFQLMKTAQIHAIDNQALQRAVVRFVEVSNRLVRREGMVSFQAKDRTLFLNRVKLKLSSDDFSLAGDIFDFFDERKMGGFVIDGLLAPDQVRRLLELAVYAPISERCLPGLAERLFESGLPVHVNRVLGAGQQGDGEVALERRAYTFITYSKLVVLYRSLLADEELHPIKRRFLVRKTTRIVQSLVDICLEDDHTFLGVTSVKSAEGYYPHHAVNTAILAITLGEKIGLSKVELADLGLAALFRDIGLREVPGELLDKRGPPTSAERTDLERHPLRSVEFLLGEPAFNKGLLRRIVVAFEHHCGVDGGGYPGLAGRPHLFSRIVAIADAFDALTTARPWRKAFLPDEALAMMLEEAGERFDPVLLKVFVNTVGLYPVGTLVRLSSGELAVVVHSGADAERSARPIVALLSSEGRPTRTIDLTDSDDDGRFLRSIVTAEDPRRYGLQPSGLLAASPVP